MLGYREGQVPAGRYDVHPEGMTRTTFEFNRKRSPAKASTEVKSLTGFVYMGHLNGRSATTSQWAQLFNYSQGW